MRTKRKPLSVGARRVPVPVRKTPSIFILTETVTDLLVLRNDGTCNPAFVLRLSDWSAPQSGCRETRR